MLIKIMLKTMSALMLLGGAVVPMGEEDDERDMYYLYIANEQGEIFYFDHVYKGEIYDYIKTGKFEYNDWLYEPSVEQQKN